MNLIRTLSTLFALVIVPALSMAAPPGSAYPGHFDHSGVINRIDHREGLIVVQDTLFHLPSTLRVTTPRSKRRTTQSLRVGQRIGATVRRDSQGYPVITGLWVLPDGHPGLPIPANRR